MVTFIGFERKLFLGLDAFFLEFLDFTGKDRGGIDGGINTVGLQGEQEGEPWCAMFFLILPHTLMEMTI